MDYYKLWLYIKCICRVVHDLGGLCEPCRKDSREDMKRELYSHDVYLNQLTLTYQLYLGGQATLPRPEKENENYVCSINRLEFQGYNV